MGHTRSSNAAFKILVILSILICTTVSEKTASEKEQPAQQQTPQQQTPPIPDKAELIIEVLYKPKKCKRLSKTSDMLTVHFSAKLAATNEEFGNSRNHSEPFKFQLGAGTVIEGWEKGLKDMCTKEIRKLTVPPHMGYGEHSVDKIPPNSTLIFEMELMKIKDGGKIRSTFEMMDTNDDNKVTMEEMTKYMRNEMSDVGWDNEVHGSVLTEIFKDDDVNNDGVISHEEYSGPKHQEL